MVDFYFPWEEQVQDLTDVRWNVFPYCLFVALCGLAICPLSPEETLEDFLHNTLFLRRIDDGCHFG